MSARFTPQQQWNAYRQMPENDMHDYSPFLRQVAKGNVLEIGVCQGVSTAALLLGLDDKNEGHLWSIDLDPKCSDLYAHPRWTFILGDSRAIVLIGDAGGHYHQPKLDPPQFDVLVIDGDHSYATATSDLQRFSTLVLPGGTILMHDVEPSPEWLPRIQRENWYPVEECAKAWQDFCAAHPAWLHYIMPGKTGLGVIVKGEA